MARQRDYAAEYQRRIERGREIGLSRPQARGHARATEPKASQVIQQIKIVAPERVAPKRQATSRPEPAERERQPRTLKEPRGKRTKVTVSQGSHNKAGKETQREIPATKYEGVRESRLENVVETVARQTPNAHIIVTVIDGEGITHVLGTHGGWNASTLTNALQESDIDELYDDISGGQGSLHGGIASWTLTVI